MNPPALGNPAHERTDGIAQNGEAPPLQAAAYRTRSIALSFIGAIDATDFLGRRGGLGASDSSGNDRFLGAHMIRAHGGPPPHVLLQRPAVPGDKELSAVKQYNGRPRSIALSFIGAIDATDFLGRRGGLGASDSSGNDRFLGAHMIRAHGGPPPHVLLQRPAVPGDKELSAVKQYNGRLTLEALGHICGISIGRPAQ